MFRKNNSSVTKKTRDLQSLIEQIGQKGDFLSVIRESLVSVGRLVAYHTALDGIGTRKAIKESRQRVKLIQRDAPRLVTTHCSCRTRSTSCSMRRWG